MNEEFKKIGNFIKYKILPAEQTVSFLLVNDREIFNQVLRNYKGVLQDRKDASLIYDTDFNLKFPLYDFSGSAKIYQLDNGFFVIDQSISRKGNPFFVCESYDDYILITKYLTIYKLEGAQKSVIECNLFNHVLIKDFLERNKFIEEKGVSLPKNTRLFKAENGYYVWVESVPKNGAQLLWNINENLHESNEIYHSLIIYESLDTMKLVGVFDSDN